MSRSFGFDQRCNKARLYLSLLTVKTFHLRYMQLLFPGLYDWHIKVVRLQYIANRGFIRSIAMICEDVHTCNMSFVIVRLWLKIVPSAYNQTNHDKAIV